ncbi:hypothetical protein [Leptospira noguchii]|uniref:Uncharacterized protein n=1 Tax=Leptospira noguchii str. 2001034031 TaxID=1193053 RepID=M6Y649_9LEPT|nr:hypothetical protein [Leptospira noguchii]EMO89185.1 hypothetical protein LEP1GSC024_4635 [Leptospira noguchii str. 2001034031]
MNSAERSLRIALNSAEHSLWIALNSAEHSLWIALNSAEHSLWIALNSAEHSLWIAFYIKTKEYYYINFPACNSLTRTENPVRPAVAARFAQILSTNSS